MQFFRKLNDNLNMRLAEILSEDRVKIPLEKTDKQSIIEEMVGLIDDSVSLPNRSQILKAVLDREKVMSTGVGEEVAIPHGKCEGVDRIVAALGITREPVDFNSLDDKPVRLIWLLIGPQDKTGPHLKALSRISRLMHRKDFRERLLDTHGPKAVLEAISSEEQKYLE
jgi:mannitol/fructose-specific phosphotransferase system IIA component (Ntr-type)